MRALRRSRIARALQYVAMIGLVLQPMPATSYWSDTNNDGTPDEVADPPPEDSWWTEDSDGDGMSNAEEATFMSDPYRMDSDYDGLTDRDERDLTPHVLYGGLYHTDPWDWDSDNDGYSDHDEYFYNLQSRSPDVHYPSLTTFYSYYDADGDGLHNQDDSDPVNLDRDGDGILNWQDSYMDDYYNGNPPPADPWYYADDDGDGTINGNDPYPGDYWNGQPHYYWNGSYYPGSWSDQDADGIPDDHDSTPVPGYTYNGIFYRGEWSDRDNDSVPDPADPTPDGTYWFEGQEYSAPLVDSDNDGIPNPADPIDSTNSHWYCGTEYPGPATDQDGDNIPDSADTWPADPWNGYDADGDGLSDWEEINTHNTSPNSVDSDEDYLTDFEELLITHTNPNDPTTGEGQTQLDFFVFSGPDTDNDGLPDLVEKHYAADPSSADATTWLTPGGDLDGDGVTNLQAYWFGWDLIVYLNQYDMDGDGMTDAQEDYWATLYPGMMDKAVFADAVQDYDNDDVMNYEEVALNMHPAIGFHIGFWNNTVDDLLYWWYLQFILPAQSAYYVPDADESGIPDILEQSPASRDWIGLPNRRNLLTPGDYDADGLPDVWEHRYGLNLRDATDAGPATEIVHQPPGEPDWRDYVNWESFWNDGGSDESDAWPQYVDMGAYEGTLADYHNSSSYRAWVKVDRDGDGLTNLAEFAAKSHPRIADSDGDGFSDGEEVQEGLNPRQRDDLEAAVLAAWNLPGTQLVVALYAGTITSPITSGQMVQINEALTAIADGGFQLLMQTALERHPTSTSANGIRELLSQMSASNGMIPVPAGGGPALSTPNPLMEDKDGDGLRLLEEWERGSRDTQKDTDNDGVPDPQDAVPYDPYFWHQRAPERFVIVPLVASGGTAIRLGPNGHYAWKKNGTWWRGQIGSTVEPEDTQLTDVWDIAHNGAVLGWDRKPETYPGVYLAFDNTYDILPQTFDMQGYGDWPEMEHHQKPVFGPSGRIWIEALARSDDPAHPGHELMHQTIANVDVGNLGHAETRWHSKMTTRWTSTWNQDSWPWPKGETPRERWSLMDANCDHVILHRFVEERISNPDTDALRTNWLFSRFYIDDSVYSNYTPAHAHVEALYRLSNSAPGLPDSKKHWFAGAHEWFDSSLELFWGEAKVGRSLGTAPQIIRTSVHPFITAAGVDQISSTGMALVYTNSWDLELWLNGRSKPLADWLSREQRLQYPGLSLIPYANSINDHGVVLASGPGGAYYAVLPVDIAVVFGLGTYAKQVITGPSGNAMGLQERSREHVKSYLEARSSWHQDGETAAYLIKDATTDKQWLVQVGSSEEFMKASLSSVPYVAFEGHSNMGIGPAFSRNHTTLDSFLNIGNAQTAINEAYFGCVYPGFFVGDVTFPERVMNYTVLPTKVNVERYPNHEGVPPYSDFWKRISLGPPITRYHFTRFDDEIDQNWAAKFGILPVGHADLPSLGYQTFFYNACSTARDYAEVFAGHGTFICSNLPVYLDVESTEAFIGAVIAGKSSAGILNDINEAQSDAGLSNAYRIVTP